MYLYGVRVHGIQQYIFDTNKLREIVWGSEIIEALSTQWLPAFLKEAQIPYDEDKLLLGAAGNIRYWFQTEAHCRHTCCHFLAYVQGKVSGLKITQAVVKLSAAGVTGPVIAELERTLEAGRNSAITGVDTGVMGRVMARRTGRPAVKKYYEDNDADFEYLDVETHNKHQYKEAVSLAGKIGKDYHFSMNMEDITRDKENGWVAVIHADGNSLSSTIKKLIKEPEGQTAASLQQFSRTLEQATVAAFRCALEAVVAEWKVLPVDDAGVRRLPLRPVILGGDDVTLIISADQAVYFTVQFLEAFEKFSKDKLGGLGYPCLQQGLTACAGIAFIKESYPLHFGVQVAEELCKAAKGRAKEEVRETSLPPASSFFFHRVQDAFVTSIDDIRQREWLHEQQDGTLRFDVGPYAIQPHEKFPAAHTLLSKVAKLQQEGAPVNALREWLVELIRRPDYAQQRMARIRQVNPGFVKALGLDDASLFQRQTDEEGKVVQYTPIYDLIALQAVAAMPEYENAHELTV